MAVKSGFSPSQSTVCLQSRAINRIGYSIISVYYTGNEYRVSNARNSSDLPADPHLHPKCDPAQCESDEQSSSPGVFTGL